MIEVKPPSHIDSISSSCYTFFSRISLCGCHLIFICILLQRSRKYFNVLSCILSCIFISFFFSLSIDGLDEHCLSHNIVSFICWAKLNPQISDERKVERKIVKEKDGKLYSIIISAFWLKSHRFFYFFLLSLSLQLKQNPCCELRRGDSKKKNWTRRIKFHMAMYKAGRERKVLRSERDTFESTSSTTLCHSISSIVS